jgi:molecular chaperone GrpE
LPDDLPGEPAEPEETSAPAAMAPVPAAAPDATEQRAVAAEARLAEVVGAYRELKKETEVFRERLGRDLERRHERKRDQLLIRFIEVVDNLERALEAATAGTANPALVEGLILVRTQLIQILQEQGLTWVPVRGLPFDPECGEVVDMQIVEDPGEDQVVLQERLRGYRLNGRIVRHAQVVVGQYRDPATAEALASEEAPASPEIEPPAALDAAPEEPPASVPDLLDDDDLP